MTERRKKGVFYPIILFQQLRYCELQDTNTNASISYWSAMRWLSVRLDLMTITIVGVVSLFVVFSAIYPDSFGGEDAASSAGIVLSYAIQVIMVQPTLAYYPNLY